MKKKNIQVVLDVSLSMKGSIGLVYLFLNQFIDRLWEFCETEWTLQMTWFSSGQRESVKFENNEFYTEDRLEFFRVFRELGLKKGKVTSAEDVKAGCLQSMSQMRGNSGDQVFFLFTDYCEKKEITLTEGSGANRIVLFVPKNGMMRYRFRMTGKDGKMQSAMPVLYWPLERLKELLKEEEWECLLKYLKEGDDDD